MTAEDSSGSEKKSRPISPPSAVRALIVVTAPPAAAACVRELSRAAVDVRCDAVDARSPAFFKMPRGSAALAGPPAPTLPGRAEGGDGEEEEAARDRVVDGRACCCC